MLALTKRDALLRWTFSCSSAQWSLVAFVVQSDWDEFVESFGEDDGQGKGKCVQGGCAPVLHTVS
jgi:hypothetical protein